MWLLLTQPSLQPVELEILDWTCLQKGNYTAFYWPVENYIDNSNNSNNNNNNNSNNNTDNDKEMQWRESVRRVSCIQRNADFGIKTTEGAIWFGNFWFYQLIFYQLSRTFRTLDFYLEKRYWILHFIYYYYLMFLSLLVHVETVADFKEELVKRC